ncbi:MAG: tyrosine-type recombinase/integrase [Rhodanobacteraceae bacterium]
MLAPSTVKNSRPRGQLYKLADERGLYLEVTPTGSKRWRLRYRRPGTRKENTLSLGIYPDVSLRKARERRDEARALVADGVDPSARRRAENAAQADTFEAIAREWLDGIRGNWVPAHAIRIEQRLANDILPVIGSKPIKSIAAPDVLALLRRVDSRGARDMAHRVSQTIGAVFRYAIATGRADADPTPALRGAIPSAKPVHFATIVDPAAVGALMRAIDGYTGTLPVRCALQLAPLVFVRPGELRKAEWAEFDLDAGEWRIPSERMKMRDVHIVPLASQAVAILRELAPLTGSGRYVFPSIRSNKRPMSENTVNASLRRMGFDKDTITGHGFRAMASTMLNEQGWVPDVIERQLAHAERNAVRAAYNHAEHLPERRRMMQAWADYLDSLRTGSGKVVPIGRRA